MSERGLSLGATAMLDPMIDRGIATSVPQVLAEPTIKKVESLEEHANARRCEDLLQRANDSQLSPSERRTACLTVAVDVFESAHLLLNRQDLAVKTVELLLAALELPDIAAGIDVDAAQKHAREIALRFPAIQDELFILINRSRAAHGFYRLEHE